MFKLANNLLLNQLRFDFRFLFLFEFLFNVVKVFTYKTSLTIQNFLNCSELIRNFEHNNSDN